MCPSSPWLVVFFQWNCVIIYYNLYINNNYNLYSDKIQKGTFRNSQKLAVSNSQNGGAPSVVQQECHFSNEHIVWGKH